MSVLQANCPSCGGQIEFQSGSTIVLVCPYCRSAVARTDRGLADLGKVADIAESESPLRLGLKGVWKETRFELTGRAQYRHELGGTWDEWYATFSNGWVGWLAEAQGHFYLTFYQPLPEGTALPTFDALQLGQFVPDIPSQTPMMVQEKGTATTAAADGEIPYQFTPNERAPYADIAGKGGAFGTIDYSSDPPWVFVGQQVTLADLGLSGAKPAERQARTVSTAAMGCPNCGGPLDLVAPDQSERVTCPNCNSLLNVDQGNLTYLHALSPPPQEQQFLLQTGIDGTFADGSKYKIIGAMIRSVTIEGIKYFWHEYLLYNPSIGFRWLVHSDNQWNFVTPVNAADVEQSGSFGAGSKVKYDGLTFKIFQDAPAVVEYVKGEFYWRVEQGETVRAVDFVSPPQMLSLEMTASEMNWSLGSYMTNAEVEKAFSISGLPKPWGIAPNQPFTGRFYYTWGFVPVLLLLVLSLFMVLATGLTKTTLNQQVQLPPMSNPQTPQVVFSQPFQIKTNSNVRISAFAPLNNSWADLDVDLVNDQSQEVESVNVPISYYQGVEDGESWSEGDQTQDAILSSLPAGQYTLRVEGTWENATQPIPVTLKVEQNVNRGVNFCFAGVLLLLVPLLNLFRKISFESRRWKDSMFGSSSSSSESDD